MTRRAILSVVAVTAVMTVIAGWPSESIPGVWTTVKARHQRCSNSSLNGTYAFLRTGINAVVGGPIAIIGTATYDGQGNFTGGREAASRNGEIQDWTDQPAGGTYSIDSDCTGSVFDATGNKNSDLVITDNGNGFLLISTLPGRTITATGRKLEHEE